MERQLFYFGCYDRIGHFLYGEGGGEIYKGRQRGLLPVNSALLPNIEQTFCPPEWKRGYLESTVPPLRIVAWWDQTLDKRPGSSSTFIGIGYNSAEEILEDAKVKFPAVMNRQEMPKPYKT